MMLTVITTRENGTKRVSLTLEKESRVEQSHRQRTNINSIVAKYKKTGKLPPTSRVPRYGDFSKFGDFHELQNKIVAAEDAFMTLPAEVRKMFANDPGGLIDFLNDPENRAEAQRMGLIEKDPTPETPEKMKAPEATEDAVADTQAVN